MRPTGKLHLGNYMGALRNWVRLQEEYACFFFIADVHALTTDYADPAQIKQNTVDVALDFLSAGLDPEKCTIFIQSHVKQHYELHTLLSMITPLSWLERVPTYKEQLENLRGKDLATYGFLGYPLLQSADILLYRPEYVPVGADQVSHVELTREVARRFNSMYKSKILPEPEALLTPTPKLPGTDGRKMSKSYGNTIGLSENPALIVHKMQSMTTNGQRLEQADPGDPDLCPVGDLHRVFSSPERLEEIQAGCRAASIPCMWCKHLAGDSITAVTQPIYSRRMELEQDIDRTWDMLVAQGEKAAAVAEQTMVPVRAALNITHDLGSVRRNFGLAPADKEKLRGIGPTGMLALDEPQRSKELRQYWRTNIVPYDIPLSMEANRSFASVERELEEPFLTAKKKRVFVGIEKAEHSMDGDATKASPLPGRAWNFTVPLKSYELWVLLLVRKDEHLEDFIIPQSIFSTSFTARRRMVKSALHKESDGLPVSILERNERFTLTFPDGMQCDITDLRREYKPFQ
jgi:tryptophanyl-tRNA synthetase